MQSSNEKNYLSEARDRLFDIVDRMLGSFDKELPRTHGVLQTKVKSPFDMSRPADHSSKADFQFEYQAIETCLEGLKTAIDAIKLSKFKDEEKVGVWRILQINVDENFRRNQNIRKTDNPIDLILNNVVAVGGLESSLQTLQALQKALLDRQRDLDKQEQLFWSLRHRAPDYYARAIALRLVKLYANETGKRPTYGTSPDTGEPSTAFTQALRAVFEILGIEGSEQTYTQWAIEKLTDDDLNGNVVNREFDSDVQTFVYLGQLHEIDLLTDRA
ncbi:hypothetical protein LP7551_03901 [Roseibium album]|nr:hypothetical protein LP7551_03901 [Roseibium album]